MDASAKATAILVQLKAHTPAATAALILTRATATVNGSQAHAPDKASAARETRNAQERTLMKLAAEAATGRAREIAETSIQPTPTDQEQHTQQADALLIIPAAI